MTRQKHSASCNVDHDPADSECSTERGTIGHRIINMIEVGLWESGWRRTGGELDD